MNWVLVLLVSSSFFAFSTFSKQISRPDEVTIGSMFTFDNVIGKVLKIALNAAVEDINSDPTVLRGTKLKLLMHDARYNNFLNIVGALQIMETDIVAVIGPQGSVMAHALSHLANELHVPFLSFTALDPSLATLQYPYFVQTAPNDLYQMMAIAEIVSYFGYRKVTAMYTDDEQSRSSTAVLGDRLAERGCKISYKSALPPDQLVTLKTITNELAKIKLMESRVIVVLTYACTRLVFKAAKNLGMMEPGYVWIAGPLLSAVYDSTLVLANFTDSVQGVLTLRPHTPDSERKRAFAAKWSRLSKGVVGLNPYGLYAYDTVWLLAYAVDKFLNQGGTVSFLNHTNLSDLGGRGAGGGLNLGALRIFNGGDQLLRNILETKMTGLTGPLQFSPGRSVLYPAFDILNWVGSGYKQIGYWSNYSGLSEVAPEKLYRKPANRSRASQQLRSVVWPGGTIVRPRGWVFPNNGRQLRVGVPNRVGFKAFVSQDPKTGLSSGYCIDVFLAAMKLLPYKVPYKFIPYGDGVQNPSHSELVNKITSSVFDVVVGDVSIVASRTRILDFSQPYIESGLVILVPLRKLDSSAWDFLRPFTLTMWGVTGAFFLIIGAVIWILEHRINDEFRGPPKKQIITVLWFSFSTVYFTHRENTISTLGRVVLCIWLFVVLIINSSYTASLTSMLTVQQLSLGIIGIESLITSNEPIGYHVGSFAGNYLSKELNIAKSRLIPLGSAEAYADALQKGTVAAVIDERPYIDVFLSEFCKFQVVGPEFTKSSWGFAFPRDSLVAADISTAILTLSENGDLQRIGDKWLKRRKCSPRVVRLESDQLHFESFWGLFLVFGVGCFLAIVIYFFHTLRRFIRHSVEPSEPSGHGNTRSARIQKFLSFADEKHDVSKSKLKRKRMELLSNANGRELDEMNGFSRIQAEIRRDEYSKDA